ncbi:MAG: Hsp20/alpha crystallin family protein [Candidatus Bathyarchaeota archaeon]|nr:Hsp20/alpha crystallin family protein [Candidatus Bathyarchaeota archaeon]
MAKEKERWALTPRVCFDHDLENYYVEVELPGVKKEDVELNVSEQSLCVRGLREDIDLLGCWYLAHPVDEDKARAKYDNGLLNVTIPLRKPLKGRKIPIK